MRTARQEDAGERERPGEKEGLREKRPGEMKQTKDDIQLTKQRRPGGPQQGRGKVTTATPCRTTRAAQATRRGSEKTCSPQRPCLPPPPLAWGCAQGPALRCQGLGPEATATLSLLVTLRTLARQAPLPMEFSRQEYRSGLPFPTPSFLALSVKAKRQEEGRK